MICHDCKSKIEGSYMEYPDGFYKCEDCYEGDPMLRNFRETEVYSRVVGYIRPVSQWNNGKKAEYKDRVVFTQ
jgi:anaerobic ribonucleoside-triphosphate reductase